MSKDYNRSIVVKGYYQWTDLENSPGVPSMERMEQGPVAFVECTQEIPCDPCEEACPAGAIKIGENITALPVLDDEKCTGCGICIPSCPGLAIFLVEKNYTKTTSLIEIPHEYHPLPCTGDEVYCTDREGKPISSGKIIKVKTSFKNNLTPVLSVEVPQEYCLEIRGVMLKGG